MDNKIGDQETQECLDLFN